MNEEHIVVEADYSDNSIWVDCNHIDLSEEEEELLSTALWKYKYKISCDLSVRNVRRPHKQYQFTMDTNQIDSVAKKLVEIVQEVFPDKVVEFSEENKYD